MEARRRASSFYLRCARNTHLLIKSRILGSAEMWFSAALLKQDPWVAKVEYFGPSGGALWHSKMHFLGLWPFGPKMSPEPKKVGLLSFLPPGSAQDDPPKRAPGPLRRVAKSVTFFRPQGSACEICIRPTYDTLFFQGFGATSCLERAPGGQLGLQSASCRF